MGRIAKRSGWPPSGSRNPLRARPPSFSTRVTTGARSAEVSRRQSFGSRPVVLGDRLRGTLRLPDFVFGAVVFGILFLLYCGITLCPAPRDARFCPNAQALHARARSEPTPPLSLDYAHRPQARDLAGKARRVDHFDDFIDVFIGVGQLRSEERRVGKECRSRWSPDH